MSETTDRFHELRGSLEYAGPDARAIAAAVLVAAEALEAIRDELERLVEALAGAPEASQ